ncbi:MAG: hypothetical protein FMNOHCHN_03766 [Ignavibacteriaceae bacterium]|nr:hypothetical protein [Ignavibacteriaceae bacterium]
MAIKHDSGKPDLALIPKEALIHEAYAYMDGLKKYGRYEYRQNGGLEYSRLTSAVMRHILAWLHGEEYAPDSGVHHLGHARAGLGMLLDYLENGIGIDDRRK